MSRYCSKCGKENDDNSKFCRGCGNRLSGIHAPNTNTNTSINTGKNDNEKALMTVIIVIVVAIVIVGIFAFISLADHGGVGKSNEGIVTDSSISLSEVHGLALAYSKNPQASSIQYKGVSFTQQQCLYIFSKAIVMRDRGLDGNINFRSFYAPSNPLKSSITHYLDKPQYVDMAQRTSSWMDKNGRGPNYTGIRVAGSPDVGYDDLTMAFANVIIQGNNRNTLPSTVSW